MNMKNGEGGRKTERSVGKEREQGTDRKREKRKKELRGKTCYHLLSSFPENLSSLVLNTHGVF